MRLGVGVLLLLLTIASAAITALWGYGKAFGTEFEVCPGAKCYSGWFGVAAFATLTLIFGLASRRLLRGRG